MSARGKGRRPPRFWYPPQGGMPFAARALAPIALGYRVAVETKRLLSRPRRVAAPVICVGNVVAGGSGKTPVCLALSERAQAAGRTPAFLTRGYGGAMKGPVMVDPAHHSAEDVGDEALLLVRAAPTAKCGDRLAGAQLALSHGADCLIMDDGYQNFGLAKDLNLLVVDGRQGLGNAQLIPAGPLREPFFSALDRADAVITVGPVLGARPVVEIAQHEGVPVLAAHLVPRDPARFKGRKVIAFSGIGAPQKFFGTLSATGANVGIALPFPDHHVFSTLEAERLLALAEEHQAALVTTAKDHARLPAGKGEGALARLRARVEVLEVAATFDQPEALDALLRPIFAS